MITSLNGNIFRVTGHLWGEFIGEFTAQMPVTRSFDIFFNLHLNKRLSKQSWAWWFETPSRLLWRHCNDSFHLRFPSLDSFVSMWLSCKCLMPICCVVSLLHNMFWMSRNSRVICCTCRKPFPLVQREGLKGQRDYCVTQTVMKHVFKIHHYRTTISWHRVI